ncbi:MAG: hypothetical protein QNJ70_20720 [Xenococcaceae cyanobacterium MO_207.B15]|nr:hypothetical protein [Xenococcaceae cyanobacterium MO_207.B15]
MRTGQVIKSITVNPSDWNKVKDNNIALVFTNNEGWYFIRKSLNIGGGFKLVNQSQKVEMNWDESDAVASQLWQSLFNNRLGL